MSSISRFVWLGSLAAIVTALIQHSVGVAVGAWLALWLAAILQDRQNRRHRR
jgi:hypothetical protein